MSANTAPPVRIPLRTSQRLKLQPWTRESSRWSWRTSATEVSRRPKLRSVGRWTVRHPGKQGGSERDSTGPGKHSRGSKKESSPREKLNRTLGSPSFVLHCFPTVRHLRFFAHPLTIQSFSRAYHCCWRKDKRACLHSPPSHHNPASYL